MSPAADSCSASSWRTSEVKLRGGAEVESEGVGYGVQTSRNSGCGGNDQRGLRTIWKREQGGAGKGTEEVGSCWKGARRREAGEWGSGVGGT